LFNFEIAFRACDFLNGFHIDRVLAKEKAFWRPTDQSEETSVKTPVNKKTNLGEHDKTKTTVATIEIHH